jgi:hypothetical protein
MEPAYNQDSTPSIFTNQKSPIRGKNYSVVQTTELIHQFIESGLVPVWAKQRVSRLEEKRLYARHMIRFRRSRQIEIVGSVYPEVILINAHDGSSSVNLMSGLYRTVCENGLIIATASFGQETIRHSRRTAMADAVEAAHRIIKHSENAGKTIKLMMNRRLSESEKEDLSSIAHKIRFGNLSELGKAVNSSLLLAHRRAEDEGDDLWYVFNRLQENVMKGGMVVRMDESIRRRKTVKVKPITGVAQLIDINRQLWEAAVQYVIDLV